jgi:hypothetical protein
LKKFSVIILNSVLEHIQDPANLMRMVSEYLEPGGTAIISVPDESAYIKNGDVSTLFHEHWSFFDEKTLKNVAAIAGMKTLSCQRSNFGASIYASIAMNQTPQKDSLEGVEDAIKLARSYIQQAHDNSFILGDECLKMTANGKTLGVYVPGRFVNAMVISNIPSLRVRFFDDDPALVGSVEVVEREALDVLEDGQTQVVHGPLARLDGGADLNDGESPSQQQVGQVEPAEDENFAGRGGSAERCGGPTSTDNGGQCVVDAVLDESWSDECGRGGQESESEVGVQGPPIGSGVREESLEQ